MKEDQNNTELAKELLKSANISINLDGWPAAVTCSVGITGIAAVIITKIIKG